MSRRLLAGLFALLLLVSLVSCGTTSTESPDPSSDGQQDTTPVSSSSDSAAALVLPRASSSLHPLYCTDRNNLALTALIWEGLFQLDETLSAQPLLCQSYSVSDDGLTWSFTLHSGVAFSDGTALTASDAADSLNAARAEDSRYCQRLAGITAVQATGDLTLDVTLAIPDGGLPALLDVPVFRANGDDLPLGTGPYRLVTDGSDWTLAARDDWWQQEALPYQEIPLRLVQSSSDLANAFNSNDVTLATVDLTGSSVPNFSGSYLVSDCVSTTMLYLGFNAASGSCQDSQVRKALSRLCDRVTLAASVLSGHAKASALPVPPAHPLYQQSLAEELSYSPDDALSLLSQAGYDNPAALHLTLLVNRENPYKVSVAEALAQEWELHGISVRVRTLPWEDFLSALTDGDFDLYLGEVSLSADFDLTSLLSPDGALNYGCYSSDSVSALLTKFQESAGDDRTKASAALYSALNREVPFAALCFKNTSVLLRNTSITGLTPTQQNPFYQISQWTVTGS